MESWEPWWVDAGVELYHVDDLADEPVPRCPHCGEPMMLQLTPGRWNCGSCPKWAWVEPALEDNTPFPQTEDR
jgi:ribosomal protein S27AE